VVIIGNGIGVRVDNVAKFMSSNGTFSCDIDGVHLFTSAECVNDQSISACISYRRVEWFKLITNGRKIRLDRFGFDMVTHENY
jgi:hypothetical protein